MLLIEVDYLFGIGGLLGLHRDCLGGKIPDVVPGDEEAELGDDENSPNEGGLDQDARDEVDSLFVVEEDVVHVEVGTLQLDDLLDPDALVGQNVQSVDDAACDPDDQQ